MMLSMHCQMLSWGGGGGGGRGGGKGRGAGGISVRGGAVCGRHRLSAPGGTIGGMTEQQEQRSHQTKHYFAHPAQQPINNS